MPDTQNSEIVEITADLVSAYVSNNPVPASELPTLIAQVHRSLSVLGGAVPAPVAEVQKPAVNPKRSVHDDYIVCLENGKKFKPKNISRPWEWVKGNSPVEVEKKTIKSNKSRKDYNM